MSALAPQKCFLTYSGSNACENLVLSVKGVVDVVWAGQHGPRR